MKGRTRANAFTMRGPAQRGFQQLVCDIPHKIARSKMKQLRLPSFFSGASRDGSSNSLRVFVLAEDCLLIETV